MIALRRLFLVALVPLSACDVAELPGGPADARDTRDTTGGDAEVTDDIAVGLVGCNPGVEPSPCKAGQFCETHALVCVDCVGYQERCVGDGAAAKREVCQAPVTGGIGVIEGGFYEPDGCAAKEVCVPKPFSTTVSCAPIVCEPGFSQCDGAGGMSACNALGTEQVTSRCEAGKACYKDRCEQIRHNVLLVFDTSSSMLSYIDPSWNVGAANATYSPVSCTNNPHPCYEAWPYCDDEEAPLSLFTLSKNVFSAVVEDAIGSFSQFALQRFPQAEAPGQGGTCGSGWYRAQNDMTGDDNARSTEGSAWFKENLGEVLVVPFPVRLTIDNTTDLLNWIDHDERVGASPTVCATSADCGVNGYCGNYNGEKRCFTHTDPELRAISQTPLGKSLFYAGEYLRRFVRVDGKACTSDATCDSAGYRCSDQGKCYDPYRKCKDDYIILFTDGGESFHNERSDFFSPIVQARRLAFGLDCTTTSDCRGEATCADNVCVVPGEAAPNPPLALGEGFGALSSPDGAPLSIKTTVITLNSLDGANAQIAAAGGGANINVTSGDAQSFRSVLRTAMTPNYKCRPEDLPPREP